MSADNYLFVKGTRVYHLFMSVDYDELPSPMFEAETWQEALLWAHAWERDNVCEYGVSFEP